MSDGPRAVLKNHGLFGFSDGGSGLAPVLKRWLRLLNVGAEWKNHDAPWCYNERASLSQFVGAVWGERGWAFEEYAITRTAEPDGEEVSLGRCDLMVEWRHFKAIIEAKQVCP